MSEKNKMLDFVSGGLVAGEQIVFAAVAQPVIPGDHLAGKNVGAALVSAALVAAAGVGVGVVYSRDPVWLVATTHRMLLVDNRSRLRSMNVSGQREVLFAAPRDALGVALRPGTVGGALLVVTERSSGAPVVLLNFGWRRMRAQEASTAILGVPAGPPSWS